MNRAVAAIILNYRGAARTAKCIRSLNGQGLDKILVVDNSEQKAAQDELRHGLDSVDFPDSNIELLVPEKNLGFAKGVNHALREDYVRGGHDYYLLINNDAEASPGMVAELLDVLDSASDLAAVAPGIRTAAGSSTSSLIWYHRYFGFLTRKPLPLSFPYLSGCCLLIKAAAIDGERLFDEAFFMYGEDAELGWRLLRKGWKTQCVEHVQVAHEQGGSSTKGKPFYEFHLVRAHLRLSFCTYRFLPEILLILPVKLAAIFGRAALRSARYRSWIPLKAMAFCGLGRFLSPDGD